MTPQSMQVNLPYGRGFLKAEVPDYSRVLALPPAAGLSDPAAEIEKGLRFPIAGEPLAAIVGRKQAKNACVVISDHTRPVPNAVILRPLLREMEQAGIPPSNILILIANGTHRKTTPEEKKELVGSEILAAYRVVDHEARDNSRLVSLDVAGRQATVNRDYYEADLKVLTGFIEPHLMAGFSGGRKAVCPGLSGVETMKYFHSPALLESPFARAGNLEDNPLHEFARKFARAAGADFIVNVTLNRTREITGVFCGDLDAAHLAGVKHCRAETTVLLESPADIVVTTNGGYPLDRDFYQSVKGMTAACPIIRQDGLIIIACECSDGIGNADFQRLLEEFSGPDGFMDMIARPGYFHMDQWEVEILVHILRKTRVKLYSSLTTGQVRTCRVEPATSVAEALSGEIKRLGGKPSIAVLPDGPYALTGLAPH